VFYALLAIFPALTALVSCYALFSDPLTISDHLAMLASVMPHDAYGIVQEQLGRITSNTTGAVSLAFFVSLSLAIWSANAGMKAIIDALNVVYEVKERRNIIKLNFISLTMTLCAIAGFLLAIGAVIVVPILLAALPFADGLPAFAWLRWPAVALLLMLGLSALYYFGPDRDEPRWRWFEAGNGIAVLAWLGGSLLLSWYLGNIANYGAAYGPFGAVIGLMLWLWLTAAVILVGAELNSEIDAARAPGRNAPRDKIRGVN
jgi:membrane protein